MAQSEFSIIEETLITKEKENHRLIKAVNSTRKYLDNCIKSEQRENKKLQKEIETLRKRLSLAHEEEVRLRSIQKEVENNV